MPATRQRRAIAVEAARIIATEGQRNFGAAKRKAAQRLGMTLLRHMPANREIEDELKIRQQLFHDGHAQLQDELRELALEVMEHFIAFQPRLAGPVLEGTADEHSSITLHLFSDDPDAPLRMLLDERISFTPSERRLRWHRDGYRTVQILSINWRQQNCDLYLFDTLDLRMSPPSPVDGLPQRRMSARDLRRMLEVAKPGFGEDVDNREP